MFTKGFTINGKHSYADYGLHISKRVIGMPSKKSIRKTVPFMSGFYDFTRINGGDTWTERDLSYTFDIIGDTVEETDAECTRVLNWLGNIHDADIYDDTMPAYRFHGSFDSASTAESDDGEYTELTVKFVCYPFKIANVETVAEGYRGAQTKRIFGQPIRPTVEALTDGRWYFRPVWEDTTANMWSNFSAGKQQSIITISEGEYVFGFSPNNQLFSPWAVKTKTENGITFTENADGTITVNGTATANAWFQLRGQAEKFLPPVGNHRLNGCPIGGGSTTYRLVAYIHNEGSDEPVYYYDYGNGGIIPVDEDAESLSVAIQIYKGYTANDLVFTPALYGKVKMTWAEEVL